MLRPEALVFAYWLDGLGGATQGTAAEVQGSSGERDLWIHLDRSEASAEQWIREASGIDPLLAEALLAEETRPREVRAGDGLLVILRGVNLNPGADPEDMVSLRMWVDAGRVVSLRNRRVVAVQDVRDALGHGQGPASAAALFVDLAEALGERMSDALNDLNEALDELEDEVITAVSSELRSRLAGVRRQAIALRRYLAPQRDVLNRLQAERVAWLGDAERARLREAADRMTRYVEDLDAIRDRAAVTQDELNNRLAERMSKTMYVLSVIAAVFLPLGLLTGLLGINVGGIPGADNHLGFAIVTTVLLVIAVGLVWLFRRLKWI